MSRATDTIAAVATAPGRGALGIVRVSGPAAPEIARAVLGRLPVPRHAHYAAFRDAHGRALDTGIALYFPAPRSFTGEHVLELQGHGGPVVLDLVLRRVLALGARAARPGEFSERAFLNDKLDLAQAEAIADLIDSASAQAARSAQRALEGALSRRVEALTESLVEARTHLEAALDFPDEELEPTEDTALAARLDDIRDAMAATLARAEQGRILRDGLTVVLAGAPNVGKSSLLNALAQREAALVTEIPGTTRDLLREAITLDGLPLHVVDTAGLRDSEDLVERLGISRAREALAAADALVVVVDDRDPALPAHLPALPGVPRIVVRNKIDLSGAEHGPAPATRDPEIRLSARTGAGLDALRDALKTLAGYRTADEGLYTARRRHLDALERAQAALLRALALAARPDAAELAAEELRIAQAALGEITGAFSSEDLLARIFSSFCIGK